MVARDRIEPVKKLFDGVGNKKAARDRLIWKAVREHGYSQVEVAQQIQLHYSTVSRVLAQYNATAKVKTLMALFMVGLELVIFKCWGLRMAERNLTP